MKLLIEAAQDTPHIMHEVLALAARHQGSLKDENQAQYERHASGLHTRALSLFTNTTLEINEHNCVATLFFSWLVALHSFHDVVRLYDQTVDPLGDFIAAIDLRRRGARNVVPWSLLQNSSLQSALSIGSKFHQSEEANISHGLECQGLRNLLDSTGVSHSDAVVLKRIINQLQISFDIDANEPEVKGSFMIWPVLLAEEYLDMLKSRKPECLVILAYYAVLLYRHRDLWFIAEGGRYLLDSIIRNVGVEWSPWLAWPRDMINV